MPKRTINNYKTNHENIPEYGNTANGYQALVSNTTGDNNTANGLSALASNKTGSGNIAIGYMAGDNLASGSKNIYLGNGGGNATESGIIRIGTPGTHTATYLAGTVYADGVGIGTGTTVAGNLTINTNTYLDDHAIYLRGLSGVDRNHGLGYNGQTTTNFGTGQYQIDGPALWGFSGGLLGTKAVAITRPCNGTPPALRSTGPEPAWSSRRRS